MKSEKLYRICLGIVGIIILISALLHGIWYWFLPRYPEMIGLTEIQWNLLNLFNWCVTIFLLFMSACAIIVSRSTSLSLNQIRAFTLMLFVFWICRLFLEFIFPVGIPFLFLANPSFLLKVLMIIAILVLIIPEILLLYTRYIRNNYGKTV